jgi:hypothetical protein
MNKNKFRGTTSETADVFSHLRECLDVFVDPIPRYLFEGDDSREKTPRGRGFLSKLANAAFSLLGGSRQEKKLATRADFDLAA